MNIIFVGRMTIDKGYDRFGNLNLVKYKKVACGKGPLSGYFSDVIDFGWQNQSNIKFLLRNSNLCIYPSRQIDADPIIVKESLFLNIPVFISNNNAHSDLINHLFGNMFVIKDWSIVDDDYITDALKSIINKPIINIELFDNFSNIHNNYCKLFNNE